MTASVSAPLLAVRRAVAAAAFTAWSAASLRGGASADDVTDAAAAAGLLRIRTTQDAESVLWALARLRNEGYRGARLLLPAPGDVLGLPGPPLLQRQALDAGIAIAFPAGAEPTTRAAVLVPSPEGEWPMQVVDVPVAASSAWPSLRQARAEFATGVAGHATALAELDVAADANGLRQVVLAEDEQPLPALPADWDGDRRELLGRARMVAVLAAAAAADDGAAVSAAEATSRAAHLRALAGISRRAIAAAGSTP